MTLPLVEELVPAPDPWDVARRLAHLPHLLFLDSAGERIPLSRYSFICADPVRWLDSPYDHLFEEVLPYPLREFPCAPVRGLPPFQGRMAGLFGYGLCRFIERLPRPAVDEFA